MQTITSAAEQFWRDAQLRLARGDVVTARVALEATIKLTPAHTHAHLLLGGIAWKEDRPRDAAQHALNAAAHVPDQAELVAAVIAALVQVGENATAHRCLHHPALAQVVSGDLSLQLAASAQTLGDHARALTWLERAHACGIDSAEFRFLYATQLSFNGRFSEGEAELERCITMEKPPGRAYLELARLRRQMPQRNHLPQIEKRLRLVEPGSENQAALEFARYKELEDLGRHGEAWQALARGNSLMASRLLRDTERNRLLQDRLTRICTAEFLHTADGVVDDGGPQPIFIVGLPRSGTTLLDRLLGSHPDAASAGELRDFGLQLHWAADHRTFDLLDETILERLATLDYAAIGRRYLAQTRWRARGKPFFIDKLPPNWLLVGLIQRALPQARILHLQREPADVCFSLYRALFGPSYAFSYDLGNLAEHYRQYRSIMAYWRETLPGRILDVPYAGLVRDCETTMRKVLQHCGLDWTTACLDPSANNSPVATLSFLQARKSVDAGFADLWRPYAPQLAPLLKSIAAG